MATIQDLQKLLVEKGVILVHFSGSRADLPPEKQYPGNLQNAIRTGMWNSFSTVGPNDDGSTHWGLVGIIGMPREFASILEATPNDNGHPRLPDDTIEVSGKEVTLEACEKAIVESQGTYNEWVLKNYNVFGLFAFGDELLHLGFTPNVPALQRDFPGVRLFSQQNGRFVEIIDGGRITPTSIEAIYNLASL